MHSPGIALGTATAEHRLHHSTEMHELKYSHRQVYLMLATLPCLYACGDDDFVDDSRGSHTVNDGGRSSSSSGGLVGASSGGGTSSSSGGGTSSSSGGGTSSSSGSTLDAGTDGGGQDPCAADDQIRCAGSDACIDPMTDVAHCGTCDNACAEGALCVLGSCETTCASPLVRCGQAPGVCADLTTSSANCGACGTTCPAGPNQIASCADSTCAASCQNGFGDCTEAAGCETPVDTPANCGACDNACASGPNSTATCIAATCGLACSAGFGDCNGSAADGCESPLVADVANCGACGTVCGADAVCADSACVCGALRPDRCGAGNAATCTSVAIDPANCGTCGHACGAAQVCRGGACVEPCPTENSAPVKISGDLECDTSFSNTGRKVGMDAAGYTYAAMRCGDSVYVSTSADNGITWSAPKSTGITGTSEVAIQGGPAGVAYLAAPTQSGPVKFVRTLNGGQTWSDSIDLAADQNNGQVSVTTSGDKVWVGASTGASVRIWRNASLGEGTFTPSDTAVASVFFDIHADVLRNKLFITTDTPSFHVLESGDDGATFGAEVNPTGVAFYSDWSLGGAYIVVGGSSPDTFYRLSTANPLDVTAVDGLQSGTDSEARALAADSAGNTYVVSGGGGNVTIQRVAVTDAVAPASRVVGQGTTPAVNVSSRCDHAAVLTYTSGTSVYGSVQAF